jgi:hypothetical protein
LQRGRFEMCNSRDVIVKKEIVAEKGGDLSDVVLGCASVGEFMRRVNDLVWFGVMVKSRRDITRNSTRKELV